MLWPASVITQAAARCSKAGQPRQAAAATNKVQQATRCLLLAATVPRHAATARGRVCTTTAAEPFLALLLVPAGLVLLHAWHACLHKHAYNYEAARRLPPHAQRPSSSRTPSRRMPCHASTCHSPLHGMQIVVPSGHVLCLDTSSWAAQEQVHCRAPQAEMQRQAMAGVRCSWSPA